MKHHLLRGGLLVLIIIGWGGVYLFDGSEPLMPTSTTAAVVPSPTTPTLATPTAVPPFDQAILTQVNALGEEGAIYAQAIQLYQTNCTVCHGSNGEGNNIGPTLKTDTLQAMSDEALFDRISEGVKGTLMAGWEGRLSPDEIAGLVTFLQDWDSLGTAEMAQAEAETAAEFEELQADLVVAIAAEDDTLLTAVGQNLFSTTCTACHGVTGEGGIGPALNSQQFLTARTDEQIAQTILNGGTMPNSVMPAFGGQLSGEKVLALVNFIQA